MKRRKKLLCLLCALAVLLPSSVSGALIQTRADTSALAASYNTNLNYIAYATEIEDQAQSSYCWAYMADAVLESYLLKSSVVSQVDLSEWDMINQLASGSYAFSDLYTGGNYRQAVAYWTRGSLYGPRRESDSGLTDYYVSETVDLGRYQRENEQSKRNYIQNIKNLVVSCGSAGVSVYFTAQDRALTTRDGAYYYPQEASPGVNHGVTVVGWDDNFAPQWFYNGLTTPRQPQNKGAFLVKNSWGKYDTSSIGGNTGYYWISYDNYFQDAFAVTKVTERSKLYDRIYETDYRGLYDYAPGNSFSQSYQLYGGSQWLTGLATYVRAGANYRFFLNGQELSGCGGTMAQSGYHTFQLSNPVLVTGTLELRAEVTSSEDAVPLACSANSHEADGGNVCLKAFTKSQWSNTTNPDGSWNPGSTVSGVTGVTMTPQDCSVMQGTSRVFTAKVLGSGLPSQRINWQISGASSPYTRISENGVLYVAADEGSAAIYVYANAYADSTHSAAARVEILKASSQDPGTGNNGSSSNGTNINGTPGNGTSGSQNPVTGTPITGTPSENDPDVSTDAPSNINGSKGDDPNEIHTTVRVGTVDKGVYSIWEDGTAQYTKCVAPNRVSVSIPASVKIGGKKYEVTVLDQGCMRGHKKAAAVTIGVNVTQIEEDAFYNCKKLKKVKIKSEQIEYIGEDAFRGIAANAVIYVPRSCLEDYRLMVRESGNSKVRVKAYN
ncbi:MAG: C1 family peptidase [Eubacterium sp.]|nr:C1 family peptidase [Eubacterium sp.]